MLAIAAPSFNAPSETFIRNHVRTIAPGRTVLLCNDGRDVEQFGVPTLSYIDPWIAPSSFRERAANAVRYRWRMYARPGLSRADRRRVVAFLTQYKVRALLAEYGPTGCLLMDACRCAGIPLFVHFHGYDASLLIRAWHHRRHYRALFRAAAGVIAPSRFLADKLLGIGCAEDKLWICPCGIDPSRFHPSSRQPGRVLAVGRLVEKKAPQLTIRAFARIVQRFPEARLDIIGDGPLREHCTALIAELGLKNRVFLHGARNNDYVATFLKQASLFVQHSITPNSGDAESFGVSLVEAMASEVPVVATRHNGFVDTVAHGVTGLLVAERDVDGMAEAMAEILANPARAAAMGAAGRRRVLEHFTIEHTRDRLRAIMGLPIATTAVTAKEPGVKLPIARKRPKGMVAR